jgi:hypothetical protein
MVNAVSHQEPRKLSIATISAISSIVGAGVAVIALLIEHTPRWRPHWALLGRVLLAAGIGIVVGFGLYFGLSAISSGRTIAKPPGKPTSIPTASRNNTSTKTSTPAPSETLMPISFISPHPDQHVGQEVTVLLKGDVPKDRHLWIFVYSSRQFYVEGAPDPEPPNYWSLAGVTFGANTPDDINAPYTIYAVLANTKANAAIKRQFDQTNGDIGTSTIPGVATVKGLPYVTVIRTH